MVDRSRVGVVDAALSRSLRRGCFVCPDVCVVALYLQ